jgi:hypothetical protein
VLISNFRRVLNVVVFLLGDSPASEFYVPTFRNTLSYLHKRCKQEDFLLTPPMNMGETECSETSEYKIQTPGITQNKEYNRQKVVVGFNVILS